MNNKKQGSKGSTVLAAVVIAAMVIFRAVSDYDMEELPIIFAVVGVITFIVIAAGASKARKGRTGDKKQAAVELNRPFPQPTAVKTKQPSPVFRHKDEAEAEEAIHCAHARGKEKYFEQIEGFYRNGLIDRAEYRALREKYEKLDLPEDYH